MDNRKEIINHSEYLESIIEDNPTWLVRNSILSISITFLLIFTTSFVIEYPDTLPILNFTIKSKIPNYKFISQDHGELELYINNNDVVMKGEWIGLIKGDINTLELKRAISYINQVSPYIENDSIIDIPYSYELMKFGSLEIFYIDFISNVEKFKHHIKDAPEYSNILSLEKKNQNQKNVIELKKRELELKKNKLRLKKNNIDVQNKLFSKGVISKLNLEKEEIDYLSAQEDYFNLKSIVESYSSNVITNKSIAREEKINQHKNLLQLKNDCLRSFMSFKNQVNLLKRKNVFIAPYSGKVGFLNVWNSNHFINIGEHLFTLEPLDVNNIGRGVITSQKLSEIRKGQKVQIRLDGYSSIEFGVLEGEISFVSNYPNEMNNYIVEIIFPTNIKTSYNIPIPIKPGLSGQGEIILKEQTLFEVFFKRIKKLIDNENH